MAALIEPVHRRDGRRAVPTSLRRLAALRMTRELDEAHDMFREMAGLVDGFGRILRRCKLDPDELLDIACRATNTTRMRLDLKQVATRLRDQAAVVKSIIWLQEAAPHYLPADDELCWRPIWELEGDAKRLENIATVIENTADRPAEPERRAQDGEFVITFRNAINGETETHYRDTAEAARELARNHQPFNNTDPRISRAIRTDSGRFDLQAVALTSEADECGQRTESSH